jgi:hypothetical protein
MLLLLIFSSFFLAIIILCNKFELAAPPYRFSKAQLSKLNFLYDFRMSMQRPQNPNNMRQLVLLPLEQKLLHNYSVSAVFLVTFNVRMKEYFWLLYSCFSL